MKWMLAFLFVSLPAFSYTPDYKMIMSRLAENNGHGYYKIVQDVAFPHDPEPLVIEETWIVFGHEDMAVTLRGKGLLKDEVSGTIVYKNGRKYFVDGNVKTVKFTSDFLEEVFHFRYSNKMKPRLVAMNIAPADSLKERPFFEGDDTKNYPRQEFLRLARTGGVVSYAIGKPTSPRQADENAGLWIEQDRFRVRKIRNDSGTTVVANNYNRYPNRFWFPKSRRYSWESFSAQALVRSVNTLPRNSNSANLVSPKRLESSKPNFTLKLPAKESIKEFYTRLR